MLAGDRSQGVITRIVCIGAYSILCDFGAFTSFSAYTRIQSEKVEIAVIDISWLDISRILPAILIISILCSSSVL